VALDRSGKQDEALQVCSLSCAGVHMCTAKPGLLLQSCSPTIMSFTMTTYTDYSTPVDGYITGRGVLQLADEVLAAAPADDHVLNMLLLVLKPAGRARDVTPAYEAACSKQPNNEELLQGLFSCHVR